MASDEQHRNVSATRSLPLHTPYAWGYGPWKVGRGQWAVRRARAMGRTGACMHIMGSARKAVNHLVCAVSRTPVRVEVHGHVHQKHGWSLRQLQRHRSSLHSWGCGRILLARRFLLRVQHALRTHPHRTRIRFSIMQCGYRSKWV